MTKRSRGKAYTRIQSEFLINGYQDLTTTELHREYNKRFHYAPRTYPAIRSFIRNRKLTCGGQGTKDNWQSGLVTRKQSDWLGEHYVDISVRDITKLFNQRYGKDLTTEQIKAFMSNRGFKSGRTGCYKKGHEPANKGCEHRPGYAPGRMAETQFKAGPRPDLRFPIWHERTDKHGYILMKCPITNPHTGVFGYHIPKHKWIWEQANGPIPENHVLTFIDDDTGNCVLDNLELITRSELCRRNKMQCKQADPEIRDSIKFVAKLQYATAQRARQESK